MYDSSVHLVLGTISHVVGDSIIPAEDDSQHTRGVKFRRNAGFIFYVECYTIPCQSRACRFSPRRFEVPKYWFHNKTRLKRGKRGKVDHIRLETFAYVVLWTVRAHELYRT